MIINLSKAYPTLYKVPVISSVDPRIFEIKYLSKGIDYHDLKPMICSLFPVTFDQELLRPSFEVLENSLICLGSGDTIYRGIREELLYYLGAELVSELDKLEPG